jgi:hypothetical protein
VLQMGPQMVINSRQSDYMVGSRHAWCVKKLWKKVEYLIVGMPYSWCIIPGWNLQASMIIFLNQTRPWKYIVDWWMDPVDVWG